MCACAIFASAGGVDADLVILRAVEYAERLAQLARRLAGCGIANTSAGRAGDGYGSLQMLGAAPLWMR